VFRSETSKGPAGLGEGDGDESRIIPIEIQEDVQAVKLSDGRSGKRWMEE
jgi:hypothetical protein